VDREQGLNRELITLRVAVLAPEDGGPDEIREYPEIEAFFSSTVVEKASHCGDQGQCPIGNVHDLLLVMNFAEDEG
jgi:hypothetical protein